MLINGKRELAYVVAIDEIKPIEGYDRVEYARTNGWWVVVSKADNLKVGDRCVYFEIDSKVPSSDERFKFLEKSGYKISTKKMCKVYSQGLLMPLSCFEEFKDANIGDDLTEALGVTHYDKEYEDAMEKVKASNGGIFTKKAFKWLMRYKIVRDLIFKIRGRDTGKLEFPDYVRKTDEERVENQPFRVGDGKFYVITEKLDGTSSTYALGRVKKTRRNDGYEFCVCSRNLRLKNETPETYQTSQKSIYWDMAFKYDIRNNLKRFLDTHKDDEWVYVQGECVGNVNGNPLKLKENDLYLFNLVTSSEGRYPSVIGRAFATAWGMKWVPIVEVNGKTQDTMEELKLAADGMSAVNPKVRREGLVYRSQDGKDSFKNVSRVYLEKHS